MKEGRGQLDMQMTKYTEVEWDAIEAAQWASETVVSNLEHGATVEDALKLAGASDGFTVAVEEERVKESDREEWVRRFLDTLYGCLTDLDNFDVGKELGDVLVSITEEQVRKHAA